MNERLARVIFMASLGGYMATHHGRLIQVDGRMIWGSLEALRTDAKRIGAETSVDVINTAR